MIVHTIELAYIIAEIVKCLALRKPFFLQFINVASVLLYSNKSCMQFLFCGLPLINKNLYILSSSNFLLVHHHHHHHHHHHRHHRHFNYLIPRQSVM